MRLTLEAPITTAGLDMTAAELLTEVRPALADLLHGAGLAEVPDTLDYSIVVDVEPPLLALVLDVELWEDPIRTGGRLYWPSTHLVGAR